MRGSAYPDEASICAPNCLENGRTAFLSAKDAKNAKESSKPGKSVAASPRLRNFALFAFFASFADKKPSSELPPIWLAA
jgi:hypothetical protein